MCAQDETIYDTKNNSIIINSLESEFFNFKSNRHRKCLPKPEAYLTRMELDEFEISSSGEILSRRIFENPKEYLEKEYSQLNQLKAEIEIYNNTNPNKPLIIPSNFTQAETLKIYQANKFNCALTIKSMFDFLNL